MRIALIGTRGVPARYGGFETCVEEVGARLVERGHHVVAYCRVERRGVLGTHHRGVVRVELPAIRARAAETLSHTALSVLDVVTRRRADVAFVFNAANAPLLPLLRVARIPVATHVDGVEWKRAKWSGAGARYYRAAESLAVRWSDALIADAQGIADYYTEEFQAPTEQISYGAPRIAPGAARLEELGLERGGYHLVVARFEPENNVDMIVDGYTRSSARLPLVVVGAAPYAKDYTRAVRELADDRVRFLGAIWDQELLDQLYANAMTYVHGHSVGGTNPSLLRAIGAGAPVAAYDVTFNAEVLADAGRYFRSAPDVTALVEQAEADGEQGAERYRARSRTAAARYDWDDVAAAYEDLAVRLAEGRTRRLALSGRRVRA